MKLEPGIYEQIISTDLSSKLSAIQEKNKKIGNIDSGSSSIALSQYIKEIVRAAFERTANINDQLLLANSIIELLAKEIDQDFSKSIIDEAKTLLEISTDSSKLLSKHAMRPATSISNSYLFTGDANMPLVLELKREIATSDSVDMLVSFLKVSGIAMLRDAFHELTSKGGKLRIICTTYMGATDSQAVRELAELPNTEIHISYDTKHTRLHAKSYIFHRRTGFSTAYIGSSNLSSAAITDGREWNMKISSHDQPDVFSQMKETFDVYWMSGEFEPFSLSDMDKLEEAISREKSHGERKEERISYSFDINPYPFQQAILDKLDAERQIWGHKRNLVVAATGTGKTVISAFDYRNFVSNHPGKINRLLFAAHREEILQQSMECFRGVLRDYNFGDLLTGKNKPSQLNYLFASIQTINSRDLTDKFDEDYFDFIIVDEFHHAAAQSYNKLLKYFKPQILLGLTATPERMDGKDILSFFDGHHIAAEIRLPEAIERQLLCPFHYYGITDSTDLSSLKWSAGGYDKSELENVYTLSEYGAQRRAGLILNSIPRYVDDVSAIRCIGFCVSIRHAQFMADFFNAHGMKSLCLTGISEESDRKEAKRLLEEREVNFIFVVDLYNEGVDIPSIDTVLFLRPTESLTIFLQQLGRGLRVSKGKEFLTVLDFIGQANKKYRFEDKFQALLTNTKRGILTEIKEGFVSVPSGCYIELERKSKEIILSNIKEALGNRSSIIERIRSFESDSGLKISLESFLDYTQIPLREIYRYGSFSKLCMEAGVREYKEEPLDDAMKLVFPRLAFADSRRWIDCILSLLRKPEAITEEMCNSTELSMLAMFLFTFYQNPTINRIDLINNVKKCPVILEEIIELLDYKRKHIDFIDRPVDIGEEISLDCYCTYSRDQILSALGHYNPNIVRQGVVHIEAKKVDLLFITLNKSDKEFSPTTLYNDYAISKEQFHWESQSTTSDTSETGQRYIHHKEMGSHIFLFVREQKSNRYGSCPYTFLGPAEFVSYEGSKPMSIIWKLKNPIPARFIKDMSRGIAI